MQNSGFESTKIPTKHCINIGGKLLDLSIPRVMGILNVTPDSFYSGSRVSDEDDIIERIKKMLKSGMDILDLGAYSSRPGAEHISEDEELDRIIPIIKLVNAEFPDLILSLDTFRARVAEKGLSCGVSIINDISGFETDSSIIKVVAEANAPYILMHMKGTPQTMTNKTDYDNLFVEMYQYFSRKIKELQTAGVKDIIIDPGIGFSKTLEQNHSLVRNLRYFTQLNKPILLGVSRKSMIYKKLGVNPENALNGTIALNAIGINQGANILRVHDVNEADELIKLLS